MNYIKKLTVQFEDSDGNITSTDIDGVYVTEIEIHRPLGPIGMFDSKFERLGPDELTIKMLVYGDAWVGATTRRQRNITPPAKQLPSATKLLAQATCTCADSYGICAVHQIKP